MAVLETMYIGVNNSPKTTLTNGVTAADSSIAVADISAFPNAPNLATIGMGTDAEVIRYNGITGNTLTGIERGFGGTTANAWETGAPICRAYTAYDHAAFKSNIEDLEVKKLAKSGSLSDMKLGAVQNVTVYSAMSEETRLSVLAGTINRIMNYFLSDKVEAGAGVQLENLGNGRMKISMTGGGSGGSGGDWAGLVVNANGIEYSGIKKIKIESDLISYVNEDEVTIYYYANNSMIEYRLDAIEQRLSQIEQQLGIDG